MDHPLDKSEPSRKLLAMAATEMARNLRQRIEVGDGFDSDAVLGISVGVDVVADGSCRFVARRWDANHRGELLCYGTL